MNSNDEAAVRGTKSSSTGTSRTRMPYSKTLALILLVSSFWQMAHSAPTPQQKDAAAGQSDDDDSVLGAESSMEAGRDYDDATTELRYGGMWEEPVEPPDIRNPNGPQSSPEIDPALSSHQENAQHATTSINTNPSLPSMVMAQRILEQEDQPDWVFNIVIQKEKALKSAFIAPDVNWLRDLVPKVVDVADKPDTLIKETIFNAIDKQDVVVKADHIEDSQIFINVVKSQVGSQDEVPEILARLRNLMQTGGPAVDSLFQRQNNGSEPSRNRAVVINVLIVNVLNVNILNVILPHSKAVIPIVDEKTATTDSVVEEDSYIVALKESQKNRNKAAAPRDVDPHHEKKLEHVPHSIAGSPAAQQQVNGRYLTEEEHSYEPSSTARPLMAMEKDYLRSHDIQPTLQQLVDDKKPLKEKSPQIDPNASLEFVNLPSGPYFTSSVEKPLELEVLIVEKSNKSQTPGVKIPGVKIEKVKVPEIKVPGVKAAEVKVPGVKLPEVKVPAASPKPNNNPSKVQKVGMVSSMTNRATNVIRNQIRTIGFFGIPLLAGLAGTANAWLPAMSALGRRRKKRSTLGYEEYDEWQPNRKVVNIDDRRRAIEDAQVLALLMGKRYMNVSKESLQDSIDNWKNRDQEANAAVALHTTEANKLASTNKPLWFQFNRPGSAQSRETTTSTTTTAPSTIKRANYNEDENYETNTNQYYSKPSPLFYSAAGSTGDSMEHREIVDYDEAETAGPSTYSTGNALTESGDYEMEDNNKPVTQSEENTATTHSESVTPHIHIIPSTSPSGYDFDIVANFVQAMMMNSNSKMKENPVVDGPENREDVDGGPENREDMMDGGPEHREDVDGPEHREEYYLVKSPSIVNSSYPGGLRVPTTGTTVSLFAADPIMPNWGVKSENVTNSPVTYVSLKAPPNVMTRPFKTTTSTQPASSSADYDDTDLIDASDLPDTYDNIGAPLQFHEDETGITFFVSKEVPGKTTTPISSTAGLTEKYATTNKPLPHWFSDPFEDGLFVGSSTASTSRPSVPPTSSVSTTTSNTPLPSTQSGTKPTVPATRPSGLRPNVQFGNRPSSPLPNFQPANQPVLQPSNSKPNSQPGNRPSAPFFNTQSNFQAGTRPPAPVTPPLQFNRPPKPISTPPKVQSSRPSSLLTMASFAAPNRLKPTVPPPVDVSSIGGSQNVKVTVTNPPTLDLSTLSGDSSLVSATVDKHNVLSSIIKGAASSPLPSNDQSTTGPSLVDSSSEMNNAFGMYSSAASPSTNRPITTTTSVEEVVGSTVDNLATQLEMNRTSYVSTKRPIGGLHFINTSTDVVILSQFDVTPSSIFSTPDEESMEAEEDYSIEPSDSIVVDAAEGNQPDSVPVVSNLANLFIASSGSSDSSSSSSSGSSSSGDVSSGGVTTSTTAASFDPFAMFYTLGLASAGIFALTLPIWVPIVVAKKRRRTGSYGPTKNKVDKKKKKKYPAKKKKNYASIKGTYGEPPPNHYKDLDEDLNYNDEDYYPAGPVNKHHQYQSTTIDDLYRGNSHDDYQDTDAERYSPLFRDLFSSNSDDVLSDPGPLSSEDIYGPSSPATYYDDRKAARRRLPSK
ncbi:uncharacterized protein LOC124195350 [Daphnia pulex]|uniref:uncharacterized protein LOC124195350 n=1 Tax=Daphnia pulex TaxID=6669 RepID=UPI001EE07DBF|nr:uncharacterized protein LOC124195350 [Daphnia pulex]